MAAEKPFYEVDPAIMKMITDGIHTFDVTLYKNVFKLQVLDQEGVLEVAKAANGYDALTKFPVMKFETLSRALLRVNGDKIPTSPDSSECKKFLSKLPDIIVDQLYVEYDSAKNARDLKIQNIMVALKNSQGSQDQEGSGDGSSNPHQPGSETSTQPKTP